MGTVLRSTLSEKNPYWIEKHRYYELKHFCLQYPYWKQQLASITDLRAHDHTRLTGGDLPDPVVAIAEQRLFYEERMTMVRDVAFETDRVIGQYIFDAVTSGASYERLFGCEVAPCSREVYYTLYRRFFWLLDKSRK